MLIFTICSTIIFSILFFFQNKKIKLLQLDYSKLCNVLAEDINGKEIIKQLTEGNKQLSNFNIDFPLSLENLELIRKKCIKKLRWISLDYLYNNEKEKLGAFWNSEYLKAFNPFTAVKKKGTKYVYLILPNNQYYFILDGKNKKLVKVGDFTYDYQYQILFDSTEIIPLLRK